ncbi:MAG: hypothetical protein WDM79_15520 [Terricaulis sp.]
MFVASALIGAFAQALPENLRMPIQALGLWGGVLVGALFLRLGKSSYGQIGFTRPKSWGKTILWALAGVVVAQIGAAGIGFVLLSVTDWAPLDVAYIRDSIRGDALAYMIWITLVGVGQRGVRRGIVRAGLCARPLANRVRPARARPRVRGARPSGNLRRAARDPRPKRRHRHRLCRPRVRVDLFRLGPQSLAPILAHGFVDTVALTLMFLDLPLPSYIR